MFYLSGVTNEHCLTSLLLFLKLSNLMIPDDIDVFDCVWAGARIVQQSDKTVGEQPNYSKLHGGRSPSHSSSESFMSTPDQRCEC